MTCTNCPSTATVRVSYFSLTIEPTEAALCPQCSFELHQEMLGHILYFGGQIEETPLEEGEQP